MAALNQLTLPQWQYLHSTTFSITDPDGTLAGAWIDHPELDPLDNTLVFNDSTVAYSRSIP